MKGSIGFNCERLSRGGLRIPGRLEQIAFTGSHIPGEFLKWRGIIDS